MDFPLSPFPPESLDPRVRFGCPVLRQPAYSHLVLTYETPLPIPAFDYVGNPLIYMGLSTTMENRLHLVTGEEAVVRFSSHCCAHTLHYHK